MSPLSHTSSYLMSSGVADGERIVSVLVEAPEKAWRSLFEGDNPLEVEIGCGKGKFLLNRAAKFPGIHFLGIDRVAKWMKIGFERSCRRKLGNLKFVKADIRIFLDCAANHATVSVFHIYFPDPWPKRRHRRRRILNADLLKLLYTCLIDGGLVEFATDDADYFESVRKAAADSGLAWTAVRESCNQRLNGGEDKTSYELKYEAQGKPLYYLEFVK